jgi:hypothetical protein
LIIFNSISNSAFIQRFFWANAGFGTLRDHPNLNNIDPRYEPTVIKSNGRQATSNNSNADYLSTLSAEDWPSKAPPKKVFPSALDYHEAYKSGSTTPLQVIEAMLPLIRRDVEGAKHSIAFLSTKVDIVRKAAEESTERYRVGKWLSVIDGVPMVCPESLASQNITV